MTDTVVPAAKAEVPAIPTKSIISRLKEKMSKEGLVVGVTDVGSGRYRVNWYKYDGFAARVVGSTFVKVDDQDGKLIITDQSK